MRYAEEHKQVTTYTPEQFQMPLSMTEMNCAIDDYLRYRIARASGNSVKIRLETLFEYCNFTDKHDRYYAKQRFDTFLKFYAEVKLIQNYIVKIGIEPIKNILKLTCKIIILPFSLLILLRGKIYYTKKYFYALAI